MTQTTGGPQPGWYPAPEEPGRLRWFDGSSWTPHRQPDPSVTPPSGPVSPGYAGLALALQLVLGVNAAIAVLDIGIGGWTRAVLGRWLAHPETIEVAVGRRIDNLTALSGVLDTVGFVVCAVLFIVWLRKAYTSRAVVPSHLRHGAGWTIGAWFVPFLNLVRPYQLVDELDAAAAARIPAPRARNGLLPAWWAAFLLMNLAGQISSRLAATTDTLDGTELNNRLRSVALVDIGGGILTIAAAVLAILVVRHITGLLTRETAPVSPGGR